MIAAIDFGCYAIRSAVRTDRITLRSERSEYVILPGKHDYHQTLTERKVPFARCEGSLVAYGNGVDRIDWLSRMPATPLFPGGRLPSADAPARQIIYLMTESLLPAPTQSGMPCCFTTPDGSESSATAEFLQQLIRMRGYDPIYCPGSHATNLACGADSAFTGISINMGIERSEICVSRLGMVLAKESIDAGAGWIDMELARQTGFHTWDDEGVCYLDIASVREWKQSDNLNLREPGDERARALSRLYGVILDRLAATVRQMLMQEPAAAMTGETRQPVICSGGPVQIPGFAGLLTERFVEQGTASRIASVRIANGPVECVTRGLLIHGELERSAVTKVA